MGAIEITRARQTLGNLPGVREADVRTGGELIGRGLDALGRGVSEFGRGLARVGVVLGKEADEEIDREADDIANAYRSDVMDLSVEQMSQPAVSDTEKWLNDTITSRTKIWNELTKDKSSRSVERAQRKLAGFDLDMKTRWQNHAAKIDRKNAIDSANASVESTMRAMEEPPEDPDAAVLKWDDCNSAMNKVLLLNGVTDSEAIKIEKRKAVEKILQSRIARPMTLDPDNANNKWPTEDDLAPDKIINAFIPDAPQEARALLSEEDLQHISAAAKKDLQTATKKAQSRKTEKANLDAYNAELELLGSDLPISQSIEEYENLSKTPELSPSVRNHFKTVLSGLKKQKISADQDAVAQGLQNIIATRQIVDDSNSPRAVDENSLRKMLSTALAEGKINAKQYANLMKSATAEVSARDMEFKDMAVGYIAKLAPNIAYKNSQFVFKPSTKVPSAQKTAIEYDKPGLWTGDATWTYAQLIQAMNLTCQWANTQKNVGPFDMLEEFKKMQTVKNVSEDIAKKSSAERLDLFRNALKDLK